MEKNTNSEGPEATVCATCGEESKQPLIAELHSGNAIEEYYACPRCLTKVRELEQDRNKEINEINEPEQDAPVKEVPVIKVGKPTEGPACPYQLGYLKRREKGVAIPEGCLTCSKMIECLTA